MDITTTTKGALYAVLLVSLIASPAMGWCLSASWGSYDPVWNGYSWTMGPVYTETHSEYSYSNTVIEETQAQSHQSTQNACGDGWCSASESIHSCPIDCRPASYCGDGFCAIGESKVSCPYDCGEIEMEVTYYCGDGICKGGETKYSCPIDCGSLSYCGDGTCDNDETKYNCAKDCGLPSFCGDGVCNRDESKYNCAEDCGMPPFCGDGFCNGEETKYSCSIDCGAPKCADPIGNEGDRTCTDRQRLVCEDGFWEFEQSVECCTNSDCGLGFACTRNICTPTTICGDGVCSGSESHCSCPVDCDGTPPSCADPRSCECDTEPPTPPRYCGDGLCSANEDCASCEVDCGSCSYCGDGVCTIGRENTDNCPEDCGEPIYREVGLQIAGDECVEIVRGENASFEVLIDNRGNAAENLNIISSGHVSSWATHADRVTLAPEESRILQIRIDVPESTEPGLYNMTLSARNAEVSRTVLLRVDVKLEQTDEQTQVVQTGADDESTGNVTAAAISAQIPQWLFAVLVLAILLVSFAILLKKNKESRTSAVIGLVKGPKTILTPDGGKRIYTTQRWNLEI